MGWDPFGNKAAKKIKQAAAAAAAAAKEAAAAQAQAFHFNASVYERNADLVEEQGLIDEARNRRQGSRFMGEQEAAFVDDPIVNMAGVTNPPLQNEANFPRQATTPGWGEVLQAEFDTQNTIGSISNYESSPAGHAFDPNFRLADALKGTRWENNPGLFVTARNQAHFDTLVRDYERDERNRRVVEDSSWGQYLPAMVLAQAVDPVNWLSLGTIGALRLAGRGGLTLASRTGAIAAGTAVDTAVQESVLQATQVNRALGESLSGIGGSAILGGLIGHVGSRLLLRNELDALSEAIEREVAAFERGETPRGNLTGEGAGVGAERAFNADGTPSPRLKFSFGADYLSQRMGPQQRLTHASSDVARRFANELIETPYFYRENAQGFVVAPRGDAIGMPGAVQTRIGLWEEPIMRAVYGMRDLYLEYRGAEHQNWAQRAAFNVADRFGRTDGAMSEVEFRQAVTDAVTAGGQHNIPQVAKAAQRVLDVIKQIEDAGVRSGVLKEGQSALPRSWLTAKIIAEKPTFKKRVVEHLQRRRSQFQGEWETVQRDHAKAASRVQPTPHTSDHGRRGVPSGCRPGQKPTHASLEASRHSSACTGCASGSSSSGLRKLSTARWMQGRAHADDHLQHYGRHPHGHERVDAHLQLRASLWGS